MGTVMNAKQLLNVDTRTEVEAADSQQPRTDTLASRKPARPARMAKRDLKRWQQRVASTNSNSAAAPAVPHTQLDADADGRSRCADMGALQAAPTPALPDAPPGAATPPVEHRCAPQYNDTAAPAATPQAQIDMDAHSLSSCSEVDASQAAPSLAVPDAPPDAAALQLIQHTAALTIASQDAACAFRAPPYASNSSPDGSPSSDSGGDGDGFLLPTPVMEVIDRILLLFRQNDISARMEEDRICEILDRIDSWLAGDMPMDLRLLCRMCVEVEEAAGGESDDEGGAEFQFGGGWDSD